MNKVFNWLKRNGLMLLCLILLAGLGIDHFSNKLSTKTELKNLDWRLDVSNYLDRVNTISTEVGVIQFLKRGYTISLDTVNYVQDGLVLSGKIGNPTAILITALTLKFSAKHSIYSSREKNFLSFLGPEEIGEGQCKVGTLMPGQTTNFRVTIPNVKQKSEGGLQLEVSFSGERYSYPP